MDDQPSRLFRKLGGCSEVVGASPDPRTPGLPLRHNGAPGHCLCSVVSAHRHGILNVEETIVKLQLIIPRFPRYFLPFGDKRECKTAWLRKAAAGPRSPNLGSELSSGVGVPGMEGNALETSAPLEARTLNCICLHDCSKV